MPFQKGQSGNPNGRPKNADSIASITREFLNSHDDNDKVRLVDALERLFNDKPEVLLHYAYGKPVEIQIEVHETDPLVAQAKAIAKELIEFRSNTNEPK